MTKVEGELRRSDVPARSRRARSTSGRRRRCLALIGGLLAVGAVCAPFAQPASATVNGPCSGSASFQTGTKADGPFTVDATAADVITIPLKDSVNWQGAISGVTGTRPVSGYVAMKLPKPWGLVKIESWGGGDETATATSASGVEDYDLPSLVPRGVEITVTAVHHDQGATCTATLRVKVEGSAFDSPLAPAALGLTVVSGGLLALAGRPRFRIRGGA